MISYCLGFAFNKDYVVLIKKTRPDHLKGKLNGIGGKVEKGELPIEAMVREFKEETGVLTGHTEWLEVTRGYANNFELIIFVMELDEVSFSELKTTTDEQVWKVPFERILMNTLGNKVKIQSDLPDLIMWSLRKREEILKDER